MPEEHESAWETNMLIAAEETLEFLDELLPRFVVTHFGKYLVCRSDTRKFWIVSTEPEASKLVTDEACTQPMPTIGTVGYYRIDAASTREQLPN